MKAFLSEECDPAQIQMVPKLFVALCKKFLALAISLGCTMAVRRTRPPRGGCRPEMWEDSAARSAASQGD